ncbi:MAG TPA: signal peptidase I [Dehalococcoidales bacterium]|nr:signal peptidase I [Dehalococcoidales bacterium]
MKTFFREFLITTILAVVIFLLLQASFQTFVIYMSSMEPNFQEGQRLVVNKAVYILGDPQRGDVVIFDAPGNRTGDYIKRAIALPGDTVEVKEGTVYINGSKADEPYIKDSPSYTLESQKIPANMYFVLGDNRNNSDDSHNGWLVPRQNIIGKAWLSIWPVDEWGVVSAYSLP